VCTAAGVPTDVPARINQGIQRSWLAKKEAAAPGRGLVLAPERLSDLVWWGLSVQEIEQLRPWLVLLPAPTPLNVNTATAEMLAIAIDGVDSSLAQRIVQARNANPFKSADQVVAMLPPLESVNRAAGLSVQSNFFELQGRLRLADRVFEERLLVERRQFEVVVLHRERPAPSRL
jgi:general secretion pathway protein K